MAMATSLATRGMIVHKSILARLGGSGGAGWGRSESYVPKPKLTLNSVNFDSITKKLQVRLLEDKILVINFKAHLIKSKNNIIHKTMKITGLGE